MASSTAKDHFPAPAPPQQGPTLAASSSSGTQPPEDESRKKNTDCVYFLASPLTCKKGSECDFRHSEYARMNPRDCWYWLNGSCLNPKCSFRHPPLDTLLGTPGDSSAGTSIKGSSTAVAGSSLPPSHTVPSTPYVAAKPTTPCIFFQKGYCLKGDRCPFVHFPNPSANKAPEFPAVNVSETSRFNTASGGLQKCSQLKTVPHTNATKAIEAVPHQPRPSVNAVKAVPTNGAFAEKRVTPQHVVSSEGLPKHNETTSRSLNNGNSRNKSGIASQTSSRDDQRFQSSSKEADDLLRESSPGFDVLVDDELRDDDYYGNDDQFSRIRAHEGRDHNEFDIGRPDRYKSLDDRHGYDKYKPVQRHARESSERSIIEGSNYDRRGAYKGANNPDGAMNSDLRQRLSKQRRTNGLNSAVNNADYPSDNLSEERRYRSSRRDSRHSPPRRDSISSRLQGRIRLPGQPSSAVNPPTMHSEREYDKGRNHSRMSPTRPQPPQSQRGRLQDRLRAKVQDDIGRDVLDYNISNFTAPKSLAELRRSKQPHSQSRELPKKSEEFASVGRRKALESSQHSEDDVSFEGPRPLSEILKRKRKAEDSEEVGKSTKNKETAAVEKQAVNVEEDNKLKEDSPSAPKQEANLPADVEENNVFETEEGQIEEGVEGNEVEEEYYEEGEAGYKYEQEGGGEGFNLEEGENGELPEDDYMEEDEEDNFAKKIGVMFS